MKKKHWLTIYLLILVISVTSIITACNNKPTKDEKSTPPVKEKEVEITGEVKITNIDWFHQSPHLQEKSGIYFFTKEDHPRELDKVFKYSKNNGWLIQLDTIKHAKFKGRNMKILSVNRTNNPTLFKVTVLMTPGGNQSKPPFRFFEASKKELPTNARLIVETDKGETLFE